MAEFTIVEHLDFILSELEHRNHNIGSLITHYSDKNIKVSSDDIHRFALKLNKDSLIDIYQYSNYSITVEGYIFEKSGGYKAKILKEENDAELVQNELDRRRTLDSHLITNTDRLNTLTFWLAIGTGALALIEVIKFVLLLPFFTK